MSVNSLVCLVAGSFEATMFEKCSAVAPQEPGSELRLLFNEKSGSESWEQRTPAVMWIMWSKLINLCTQQFMSLNMSIEGPGTGHSRPGCQTDCAHYSCLTRLGVLPIKISHLQIVEREPFSTRNREIIRPPLSFQLQFVFLTPAPLPLTPGRTNINIKKLATRAPFVSSSACSVLRPGNQTA